VNTPKPIQYFILALLIVTMPVVHSNSLFGSCAEAFAAGVARGIVTSIANAPISTKTKIGIGLTALIVTYALIQYVQKTSHDVALKRSWLSTSESLVLTLKESDLNDLTNEKGRLILQETNNKGSILTFAALNNPGILNSLIQHGKLTRQLHKDDLDDTLFNLAKSVLTVDKRPSIVTLIKHGADVNAKKPRWYSPNYDRKWIGTPLTDAIVHNTPDMVRVFLENGSALIDEETNVYDYVERNNYYRYRKQISALLDNHRREMANKYKAEARAYVESEYPLMDKRPLEGF
jgi:hypothetical protein